MTNEIHLSHGLRGNPQEFNSGLSGRKEKMDDHGRQFWWLLLRDLPFEVVGISMFMQRPGLTLLTISAVPKDS